MKKKILVPIIIVSALLLITGALYFSLTRTKEIVYMSSDDINYSELIDNVEISDWNEYIFTATNEEIEPILLGVVKEYSKDVDELKDVSITGVNLGENSISVNALYKRKYINIPVKLFVDVDAKDDVVEMKATKVRLGIIPIRSKRLLENAEYSFDLSSQNLPVSIDDLKIQKKSITAAFTLNNENASDMLYDYIDNNLSDFVLDTKLKSIDNQSIEADSKVVESTINQYLNEYLEQVEQKGLVKVESIVYHSFDSTMDLEVILAGIGLSVPVECDISIKDNVIYVDIIRILSVNELISDMIESMISEFYVDLATAGVPTWITVNSMEIHPITTNIVYSIDADEMYKSNSGDVFSVIGYGTGDIFPFSINLDTINNYLDAELQNRVIAMDDISSVSLSLEQQYIDAQININGIDIAVSIPYEISAENSVIHLKGTTPKELAIDNHPVPNDDINEIFTENIDLNIDISTMIPRNLFDLSRINVGSEYVNLDFIIN